MIPLYAKHVQKGKDGTPVQWHFYSTFYQDEPLIIASLFGVSVHVAVLGFENDANFEFKRDESKEIAQDIKNNLKEKSKALRRIIKVGVFGE